MAEYNSRPAGETEGKHVKFQEPPKSPTPHRSEEEMEIQEAAPVKFDPPKEPEVLVISPKPDLDDSDGETLRQVIQERATA